MHTSYADLLNSIQKVQILSRNRLKSIATICMVIDHVAKVFYSSIASKIINPALIKNTITPTHLEIIHFIYNKVLCGIGAVAFPIFAFLFAEGFTYTHNRKKLLIRLLIFAVISEFPFDATFFRPWGPLSPNWPWYWYHQNVFFTYLQAFCTLWLIEVAKKKFSKSISYVLNCAIILVSYYFADSLILGDYGGFGIILISIAYILREKRLVQIEALFVAKLILNRFYHPISFIISSILILMYDRKKATQNHKSFFYIFYPAHIAVIGLLDWLIFVVIWNALSLSSL